MEAFLQKIADAKDVTDLIECDPSDINFFEPTPSPSTTSRVCNYRLLSCTLPSKTTGFADCF